MAGIIDISTLGKIDIHGPDAAELLNRVYVNGWSGLAVGRARYGVMLRDDGFVLDDGTTSRLGAMHYFMTTTTGGAGTVMAHLEFLLDTAWPDLDVRVASVTDQWAALAVSGPQSGRILAACFPEQDLSDRLLPPMGVLELAWRGQLVRLIRISFSGERAYEVYTPAGGGLALWEHVWATGRAFDLEPYGIEALGALRVEKGHVGGTELDGRTTLDDLGLGRMASTKKPFVGSALRHRPALMDEDRRRLVGLEPLEPGGRLRTAAILFESGEPQQGHGRGHVTAVTYSPTIGHYVALALVEGGPARIGQEMIAVHPLKSESLQVRVVSPVFLDPEGTRISA